MPISHTLTLTALSPARCSRPTAPTNLRRPTSRPDTQWLCLSRYDTQWPLCRRFPWFSSSHRLRVPVRLSRSPMLRTSALPDLQFLAFGNSQFDSLIFTFDLALLDFSMSIRSTSRIDLVVLVPDVIWFEFSVVRNVRFSFP